MQTNNGHNLHAMVKQGGIVVAQLEMLVDILGIKVRQCRVVVTMQRAVLKVVEQSWHKFCGEGNDHAIGDHRQLADGVQNTIPNADVLHSKASTFSD